MLEYMKAQKKQMLLWGRYFAKNLFYPYILIFIYVNLISIFIEPPGINEQDKRDSLSERMQKRGNTNETLIKQRLKRFELELSYKEKFNHSFINEDLKDTTLKIEKVIKENIK